MNVNAIKIRVRISNVLTYYSYYSYYSYLQDLIHVFKSGRNDLRSSNDVLRLDVPIPKRIVGETAFSFIGPKLWNGLPKKIRQAKNVKLFKKQLRNNLFPKD